ncbi:MAG: SDR family oxidoreductase [Acidobacteria bacterium]|nr:SDR family oxidoreductase [Acidobacteriota bacterium]
MSFDFARKITVITGAASGIGRAAALMFAQYGATVAAVDIADAGETVNAINNAGGTAAAFKCDITDEKQVKKMIEDVAAAFGGIDIAFNCAGIGPDGVRIPYCPLTEACADDWQKIVDVNLTGTFFCIKHELIQMQKQGFGAIVNTSSTGGDRFAPGFHAYGPAKAGVVALTEMAANENARSGIRINCVSPGPTAGTQLMDNTLSADGNMEEILKERVIPMGKFGSVEDVVQAVMWLCSDLSGHTTGHTLFVDGGMHVKP